MNTRMQPCTYVRCVLHNMRFSALLLSEEDKVSYRSIFCEFLEVFGFLESQPTNRQCGQIQLRRPVEGTVWQAGTLQSIWLLLSEINHQMNEVVCFSCKGMLSSAPLSARCCLQ